MPASGKRVEDMAPVELTDGEEVQRRGEQAHPGGAAHGVEVDIAGGGAGEEQRLRERQQGRHSEGDIAARVDFRDHLRVGHADEEGGHEEDEAGEGAGHADIE